MKTITLSLELLTPAFIGGATPRQIDPHMPLRPTSVRGALRTWFRAAAAAVLWPADGGRDAQEAMVSDLRKIEERIFGSTKVASPVVVLPSRGGSTRQYAREGIPDPKQWPGLRYLGYGLFEERGSPPEALITDARSPRVEVTLGLRRSFEGLEEILGATAWLWVHFGGIGARSRRGFGSLHLAGQNGLNAPQDLLEMPADRKALIDKLVHGLDWVTEVFRLALPKLTTHPLETGPGPHPRVRTLDGIGTITVLPPSWPSALDALEHAGRHFRGFRSTLERRGLGLPGLPDYLTVKSAIQRGVVPRTVERAAFGLPLPFYFRSLSGAQTTFVPEDGDRLASPLHFRIHALGDGRGARVHAAVLVHLAEANGALPLLGCKMVQRNDRRPIDAPDGRLVQQFIEWALAQAQRSPHARLGDRR